MISSEKINFLIAVKANNNTATNSSCELPKLLEMSFFRALVSSNYWGKIQNSNVFDEFILRKDLEKLAAYNL